MRLLLCLLLAACAAPAPPTPGRDEGGSVLARASEVAALAARGEGRRIAGECLSACTLYLALPGACFEEGATLGFHGPRRLDGAPLPPIRFEATTRLMASHYPPRIARWFMDEARHSRAIVRVPAADLVARGEARACPRRVSP